MAESGVRNGQLDGTAPRPAPPDDRVATTPGWLVPPAPPATARRRRRRGWILAAAIAGIAAAVIGVLVANSGEKAEEPTPPELSKPSVRTEPTTPPETATTQPASDGDPVVLDGILEDLHDRLDTVSAALGANPELARDPDAPEVQELRDIYSLRTNAFDRTLEGLRQMANEGIVSRAGPSGVYSDTIVIGPLESDDPDRMSYHLCYYSDAERVVAATGEVVEADVIVLFGVGYADRVGGVWSIYDFGVFEDQTEVEHYPSGTPNPCPSRISEPIG